ncbi:lipocalin family protein [Chitinophaga sp. GCM10012297]|uniref:Lipocalin family protein n=1 Tax=Chitinophaga chungangae TaxID=2821488 RepID=A0ABS3YEI6_9BACT|nr:lipocalin family protein [Chitinophaga chungangae]MBO9153078.1 lipocalin family protein [Chitinophaga chungangae]
MKKLIFLAVFFAACSSNNNDNAGPGAVTSGTWRVSHFSERGDDETGDFSGYSFSFSGNGSATAVRSGNSQTGTWSVNGSSTRFSIDFGAKTDANKPLGELTDDWKVISISASEIKLTDDNATSAEFLTFAKN